MSWGHVSHFTVDEGKGLLNPSCDKEKGKHRGREVEFYSKQKNNKKKLDKEGLVYTPCYPPFHVWV